MSEHWHPEANEDALRAICETLNSRFGRNFFARIEEGELRVTIGGHEVIVAMDGHLTGESSMPHDIRI